MLSLYLLLIETESEKMRFTQLYELYEQRMYRAAFTICRDESLAEDAVHDAFLYLAQHWEKIGRIEDPGTGAYVHLVTRAKATDIMRARKEIVDSSIVSAAAVAAGVEDTFFDRYDAQLMCRLICQLPEQVRTPLLLRYERGMDYAQIGSLLHISAEAARKRVQRAKAMLAQALREHEDAR